MAGYRGRPAEFASQVLGSRWWRMQAEAAQLVAAGPRTVIKSANGVGKTYLAADLALWFLYTHSPSIVLTTAPTQRQVRQLLWEEIRRRHRSARVALPGRVTQAGLRVGDGWYALGLATNDDVRFQGFHAEHLFIVFDEASGIDGAIWQAAEGVAVGANNRMLAIGNPLRTSGRFYELFRDAGSWQRMTISALDHPNVTGDGPCIPGAVTRAALEARIAEWCEEVGGDAADGPDLFRWGGRRYLPDNRFRTRVLGEFPDAGDATLIPMRWIEAAMARALPAGGRRRAAVDVARFGSDSTVIGVREGAALIWMQAVRGSDTMATAGRVARMAYEMRPETIAVDVVGLGAGVVDRLREAGIAGVIAFNGGMPAHSPERFANRRAETYWGLRERFQAGDIALPRDDVLLEQLVGIRYGYTSRGQICIESKVEARRRGISSPDRADTLAMLFDASGEWPALRERVPRGSLDRAAMEADMAGW